METEVHSPDGKQNRCPYHESTRRTQIVKLEAYNVISALKDYVKMYSLTASLVPVLGADTISSRINHDNILIRHLKQLASKNVADEEIFLDFENLRPFLDVLKSFDAKQGHIIIACTETLSKFFNCNTACFDGLNVPKVLNMIFGGVLSVFSNNIEPKEDLITLKILHCLEDFLRCKGGNLITNENVCQMFKLILTILTGRHRNSAIRKLLHDKVVSLLQLSLGQDVEGEETTSDPTELLRRRISTYIFISLLISQSTTVYPFSYHPEDSYLSTDHREVLANFRSCFSELIQNISAFPGMWNEFFQDVCMIGLHCLNQSIELVKFSPATFSVIVPVIQTYLTSSIYRMCFTESLSVYCLVLRSLKNLYFRFRISLKSHMEVFLSHIIWSIINLVCSAKPHPFKSDIAEMNMEFVLDLCQNPQLLMEMYVNYDCDVMCCNLFDLLIKGLISCILPLKELDGVNLSVLPQLKSKKSSNKNVNKKKASLAVPYKSEQTSNTKFESMALCALTNVLRFLSSDTQENVNVHGTKVPGVGYIYNQKNWKNKLQKAASIFNTSKLGDDWIPLVKTLDIIPEKHTAKDIAIFLKYVPELDLKKVGEYLGTHKNPDFMDQVRKNFVLLHNFAGMPIVMAIRAFLSSFRLPGESQQIERIIEVFAATYFESQPSAEDSPNLDGTVERVAGNIVPRWIIQENLFWKLHFASHGLVHPCLCGEVGKDDKCEPSECTYANNFERYFICRGTDDLISKERLRNICNLIKNTPPSVEVGNKDKIDDFSGETDDYPKFSGSESFAATKDLKPGFACISNSDVVFVLAYSIIMLNTDQHNQQIKRRMKLEDFIRNNKSINDGKDLPFEFLEDIYMSIKHHEIKLHQSSDKVDMCYDEYFWNDHVLQRQKLLGSYSVDITMDNVTIKGEMFQILDQNHVVKSLNGAFLAAQTVCELKQYIRIFWLFTRVALKFKQYQLVNTILQLSGISVTDNMGYRCQLSLSFVLNVLAVAYSFFDHVSWSKLMDIVFRLYCLNLLPMSFAHLDVSPHIYGSCKEFIDNLVPPSIRFKRYTDLKKNAGWLVGWTSLIPFNRSSITHGPESVDHTTNEKNEDAIYTNDVYYNMNDQQPFLFLFDVQSGTDDLLSNEHFDVNLIRNKCSPVRSPEDEGAINEVTRAFGNEIDREELLPQVLSYINLRLAFLNIYKLSDLFMGTVICSSRRSFFSFVKIIMKRIFGPTLEEYGPDQESQQQFFGLTLSNNQSQSAIYTNKADMLNNAGALLDPCPKELCLFRYKTDSVFFLGVFTRVVTTVLGETKHHLKNYDQLDGNLNRKFKTTLMLSVKCFYTLCKQFIVEDAVPYVPDSHCVLKKFGLLNICEECYDHTEGNESLESSIYLDRVAQARLTISSTFFSHICITMLKLSLWYAENSEGNVDITRDGRVESFRDDLNGVGCVSSLNIFPGVKWVDLCLTMSAWLLHLVIHFDNKVLAYHFESVVKVLYNIVTNQDLMCNKYLVMITLCGLQRIVNPILPFSVTSNTEMAVTGGEIVCAVPKSTASINYTIGSIVPVLLRRSKCLNALSSQKIAMTVAQTLLSVALFLRPSVKGENANAPGDWSENLMAIQLLIEFKTFPSGECNNEEYLWSLSLHCLSIICSVGPKRLYNESVKGLTKLLLQEPFPASRCSPITQFVRIFDYILAPTLTGKFQYPLLRERMVEPISEAVPLQESDKTSFWDLPNPFLVGDGVFDNPTDKYADFCAVDVSFETTWMSHVIASYLSNFKSNDEEDTTSRKAGMTNLMCHVMLSKLSLLISGELDEVPQHLVKDAASNLECLLYSSDKGTCSKHCIRRFVTIIHYILNVIIPSNGENHFGPGCDTFLESLKNFILVILTTPELKQAPEECTNHFRNDAELRSCMVLAGESIDVADVSPGEYVLASLLAHMFSASDILKDMFLDIIKVVFPQQKRPVSTNEPNPQA